jgi:hypothetical protein
MNWEGVIKNHSSVQSVYGAAELLRDPLQTVGLESKFYREHNGIPAARVSSTVQRAVDYGNIKVSFTVTIECPQNEGFIDMAGHVAFEKAKELTDDAFCSIVQDAVRLP